MKNYFIIHGSFGNNRENWFGWLEDFLTKKGERVFNFNYPTPIGQNFKNWSKVLDNVKDKITEKSVFICHSIAPIFLIKYCIRNKIKISKLISVSGANNFKTGNLEFDKINQTMFLEDVSAFKDLCKKRICFYSKNDPYIKYDALQDFAKSIDAQEVVYEKAGHFNTNAGYNEFHEIIRYL